jgi:predicted dehydrogenase
MIADGKLDLSPLISHRYSFENAIDGYKILSKDKSCLGILLEYPIKNDRVTNSEIRFNTTKSGSEASQPVCGFIGAGNYASRILIPAFKKAEVQLGTIVSRGGLSCAHHGKKNGFLKASTDPDSILKDKVTNTLVIATRHNSHARYVIDGLKAGKHIFVEKPLALTLDQIGEIENIYRNLNTDGYCPLLMIGFNRRFAPHIRKIKELLASIKQPKSFIITVNAGEIPSNHWTQDPCIGGGRIIGEGCHFVDLLRFLAEASIKNTNAVMIGCGQERTIRNDKVSITLEFADGSFGTIHYLANGSRQFPKERIEIFCAGRVLQLDNFRTLKGYGWPGFKKMKLWRQDKGQDACAATFLDAIKHGKASPIPFEEIIEVSKKVIEINERLVSG